MVLTKRPIGYVFALLIGLLLAVTAVQANTPTLSAVKLQLVAGFPAAVIDVTHVGDDRLLVAVQSGTVRLINADGTLNPTPLLDLAGKVGTAAPEQGLLGLAVHPDFATNGYFFVNYTDLNGDTLVERYTISAQNPDVADPASAKMILAVDQPAGNHNSGVLRFGPDGYLYIAFGDGGGGGDPNDNAQNRDALLGKVLRLNIDTDAPYAIPADNPFADGVNGAPEIWLLGVRNPWRMAFDAQTGELWLADVGQRTYEEVNVLPAATGGLNLGWDCYEATAEYPITADDPGDQSPVCATLTPADFTPPIYFYEHGGSPFRCSITGGSVYRGSRFPEMDGLYFFADLCSQEVWMIGPGPAYSVTPIAVDGGLPGQPTTFGTNSAGDLYIGLRNGALYRMVPMPPAAVRLGGLATQAAYPAVLLTAGLLLGMTAAYGVMRRAKRR